MPNITYCEAGDLSGWYFDLTGAPVLPAKIQGMTQNGEIIIYDGSKSDSIMGPYTTKEEAENDLREYMDN